MTAGGIVPIHSTVSTIQPGMATSTVTLALVAPSFNLLDAKHVASITLRSNGSGAHIAAELTISSAQLWEPLRQKSAPAGTAGLVGPNPTPKSSTVSPAFAAPVG